jgi:hypothetical protein
MVEPFTGTADQQAMQTVLWSVGIRAATGDEDSRRKTVFSVEDKQFGDDIHRAIEFAEALVGISHA